MRFQVVISLVWRGCATFGGTARHTELVKSQRVRQVTRRGRRRRRTHSQPPRYHMNTILVTFDLASYSVICWRWRDFATLDGTLNYIGKSRGGAVLLSAPKIY